MPQPIGALPPVVAELQAIFAELPDDDLIRKLRGPGRRGAHSSAELRRQIVRQYQGEPIIDPNPGHKRAVAKTVKTPEWKAIYGKRTAIERINSRLKAFRKLDFVRVRGRHKVTLHAFLSVMVMQAQALATGSRTSVRSLC